MPLVTIERNVSDRHLRQFASAWTLACAFLAHALWRKWHLPAGAVGALACGGLVLAVGLPFPRAVRPLYLGFSIATFPLAWVMSHLILGAVYFLLLTPIGFLLRACGRDPLNLRPDRERGTYWTGRPATPEKRRYFNQY